MLHIQHQNVEAYQLGYVQEKLSVYTVFLFLAKFHMLATGEKKNRLATGTKAFLIWKKKGKLLPHSEDFIFL